MGPGMQYSRHAVDRMVLRKITRREVEDTLRDYQTASPGRDGAMNYYKVIGVRRIRVTVASDGLTIRTVAEEPL